MARYIHKSSEVEAVKIDTSKPAQFPAGVRLNVSSPTGCSYGTLLSVDLGGGNFKIDGFPIANGEYFLTYFDGSVSKMEAVQFESQFSDKSGPSPFFGAVENTTVAKKRGKKNGKT